MHTSNLNKVETNFKFEWNIQKLEMKPEKAISNLNSDTSIRKNEEINAWNICYNFEIYFLAQIIILL